MSTTPTPLNEPLKATAQTTSARLLALAGAAALVLPVIVPIVCNATLPAPDAATAKAFYNANLGTLLSLLLGTSAVGTVGSSLLQRWGKIATLLSALGVPDLSTSDQPATPAAAAAPAGDPTAEVTDGDVQTPTAG